MPINAIAPNIYSQVITTLRTSRPSGRKLEYIERERTAQRRLRVMLKEHTKVLRGNGLLVKGPFLRRIPFPEHLRDGLIRIIN